MDGFAIVASLLCTAALFTYLNQRFVRLPATIGLILIGVVLTARWVAVGVPLLALRKLRHLTPHAVQGLSMAPLLRRLGLGGAEGRG